MVTGCPGVHSILSIVSRGVLMMMEIASILPSSPAWWLVTMLPAINGHHISHAHVTLHDQNNLAHIFIFIPIVIRHFTECRSYVMFCICIFIKPFLNQNIFMEYVDIFLCPELIAPCVCVAVTRAGGWWGPPPGLLGSSAADIFIFWPGAAAAPPQLVRRQSIDRTLDTSRHTPS